MQSGGLKPFENCQNQQAGGWERENTRVAESIWIAWQIRAHGGGECCLQSLKDSSQPDLLVQGGDLNDLLTALLMCHHSNGKPVAHLAAWH